jgi:hypothetical protein
MGLTFQSFGFFGFLKNINGDGHIKTSASVNGIKWRRAPINQLTETGKTTTSVGHHWSRSAVLISRLKNTVG